MQSCTADIANHKIGSADRITGITVYFPLRKLVFFIIIQHFEISDWSDPARQRLLVDLQLTPRDLGVMCCSSEAHRFRFPFPFYHFLPVQSNLIASESSRIEATLQTCRLLQPLSLEASHPSISASVSSFYLTQDAKEPPAILTSFPFIGPLVGMLREKIKFPPSTKVCPCRLSWFRACLERALIRFWTETHTSSRSTLCACHFHACTL